MKAGDRSARERLFSEYYPYARSLARRHFLDRKTGDIELGDLCQLAAAGLLEAIDAFDLERGIPFKGFARRRIVGSILDGVSRMSEVRQQQSFRNRVRRERTRSIGIESPKVAALSGKDALQALIDVAMGLALGFMLEDTSLYRSPTSEQPAVSSYDSLVWKEAVAAVHSALEALPAQEFAVIRGHYLDGLQFEQVAQLLGLSKGRVSQIHRAGLTRLKTRLGSNGHFNLSG
jgi:RNA polymerase sigma factor for flagellar operon FliA